ncbi:GNAT family N-acetyltransferase [Fimbriimonas ginsengisoli]|uniref:GCN5-related N-acetyltransferase n=1 Tax=Fimbriimonas ginsengisoli Gsoil 348 TaxID=661478 RepID=A0A068NZ64_FIMGI|nr:GNAT family N-acetyltransferase [Fimbriimonas ginsengisoli]AIE88029.1 GCN5-related N-acetyltransferase [Fimbriimonas ginsengisoli Gsoil 348]
MSLSLRVATNRDVDDVVRVIRAVYDEYSFAWEEDGYHADLYDLEKAYAAIGDTFYVATWQGETVGTAALERFDAVPGEIGAIVEHNGFLRVGGADCSIERLYVHPNGRKRGVGQALMNRVIEDARNEGRSRMEIWSDKRFTDAHRLYERLGARVVGERICDDPDVSPEWGLLLDL